MYVHCVVLYALAHHCSPLPLHFSEQLFWPSFIPGLPNLFNIHEKEEEPGIQSHVTNVTPYTKVERVACHDNWAWVCYIFKRSSSTSMEDFVLKPSSDCSRILEGLKELCLINWSLWTDLKSTVVDNISFMTSCQCEIGYQALPLFLCTLKRSESVGTRLVSSLPCMKFQMHNWLAKGNNNKH